MYAIAQVSTRDSSKAMKWQVGDTMRLKISKTKGGTYQIRSLSIKQLRELEERHKAKNFRRTWELSLDGRSIIFELARAIRDAGARHSIPLQSLLI